MEILSSERKMCEIEGKTLPEGGELCMLEFCKVCEDGKLEIPIEQSMDDDDLLADPGESYFVPVCS